MLDTHAACTRVRARASASDHECTFAGLPVRTRCTARHMPCGTPHRAERAPTTSATFFLDLNMRPEASLARRFLLHTGSGML